MLEATELVVGGDDLDGVAIVAEAFMSVKDCNLSVGRLCFPLEAQVELSERDQRMMLKSRREWLLPRRQGCLLHNQSEQYGKG